MFVPLVEAMLAGKPLRLKAQSRRPVRFLIAEIVTGADVIITGSQNFHRGISCG